MAEQTDLQRYITAQEGQYSRALTEVKNGRKTGHWMWYIFPQIQGLGMSDTSRRYAIKDIDEAQHYLNHPVLGQRLKEIAAALLLLPQSNATHIFGSPDDMKLRSSMTLFAAVPQTDPVFQAVLDKYYKGQKDNKTLDILQKQEAS